MFAAKELKLETIKVLCSPTTTACSEFHILL